MTLPAASRVSDDQLNRLVTGFLAAADFVECSDIDDMRGTEWSESAKTYAKTNIILGLKKISQADWEHLVIVMPTHQDTDNDKFISIGVDWYYQLSGYGVGFSDRKEIPARLANTIIEAIPKDLKQIFVQLDKNDEKFFCH